MIAASRECIYCRRDSALTMYRKRVHHHHHRHHRWQCDFVVALCFGNSIDFAFDVLGFNARIDRVLAFVLAAISRRLDQQPTCNIPIPIPVIHSAAYGGCDAVREKCIERVMLMVHQQQLAAVADWERGHWLEIELFCYIYYIYYIYIHRSTGTTNPLLQYTTYTYIDFIMATCLYFIRIVQAN